MAAVKSPLEGIVAQLRRQDGETVVSGENIMDIEAMKMLFEVKAPVGGTLMLLVALSDYVRKGQAVAEIAES